jgi:two-component system, HptB-dependent secretion and biofilm response regulator
MVQPEAPSGAPEIITCLIADDDRLARAPVVMHLTQLGYRVLEANHGGEALALYEQHQPDVVLMDVMMPVMDGYEVTRALRERSGGHFVPVIFLTGFAEQSVLRRCIDAGGEDFVSKPTDPTLIEFKIRGLMRSKRLYHSLEEQTALVSSYAENMRQEQEAAERVFRKMIHRGALSDPCFRYLLSPSALFNGDLLFAARLPHGGYRVLLGDFTGHGLPAAIGALPLAEIFYAMSAKGCSLPELVLEMNHKLKLVLPSGLFCAATLLDVDANWSHLSVWSAGVPDTLILQRDGALRAMEGGNLPLGIVESARYTPRVADTTLLPGDRIYLHSDGINEAPNAAGEMFGAERVTGCLRAFAMDDAFGALLNALEYFRGDAGQADDMTLLEMCRVEAAHA